MCAFSTGVNSDRTLSEQEAPGPGEINRRRFEFRVSSDTHFDPFRCQRRSLVRSLAVDFFVRHGVADSLQDRRQEIISVTMMDSPTTPPGYMSEDGDNNESHSE